VNFKRGKELNINSSKKPDFEGDHFDALYGTTPIMQEIFALLKRVAPTNLSIVIVGETGTGKELVARAIHKYSQRRDKPFVVVDCGVVSKHLVEDELFGHERGAYTGAERARSGAFEIANQGTIFLDEIGELSLDLQPKLLRALEQGEVKRLGATHPINVDVRVIAASNRDLWVEIAQKNFREDLYYRLAEVVITLPPLRKRQDDIPLLVKHFLKTESPPSKPEYIVSPEVMKVFKAYPWPGNVRELRNIIRNITVFCEKRVINIEDIPKLESRPASFPIKELENLPLKEARAQWNLSLEREYIIKVIQNSKGNIKKAAQIAQIHPKSITRLLKKYNLKLKDILQTKEGEMTT
jgi:DNA-binding NtrC family response regulator